MNRVLQLGFQGSNITRFVAPPRIRTVESSLFLRTALMGSKKRPLSNALKSAGSIMEVKKLRSEPRTSQLLPDDIKDSNEKLSGEEFQIIRDDPKKIDKMTVLQLKDALRRLGKPAKGSKRDLVSSLRCYVEESANAEDSYVVGEGGYHPTHSSCEPAKMKSGTENLPSSGIKQYKRREKQSLMKLKSSDNLDNVVKGKKLSHGKGSMSISSEVVRVDEEICVSHAQSEPWTILAHKKPQKGWVPYNPRTMRPPSLAADSKHLKLISWNVNGLRALLKLESFSALQLAQRENFDVLCLQETKLKEKDVDAIKETLIDGYDNSFWSCSVSKLGYSGTAIISRIKLLSVRYGLGISDHDNEGRVVTVEFDSFYLISAYVPNSGDGLKRLSYRIDEWDPSLSNHMKDLEKTKPVILTGDLNCAHEEIDIYNPAGNRRSAGFTIEERQSFGTNFLAKGFVDTFRKQHPGVIGYTYWGYRHGGRKTNKGWRLDYFLASESIADRVHDSYILPDVTGSDHCPIGLVLKV